MLDQQTIEQLKVFFEDRLWSFERIAWYLDIDVKTVRNVISKEAGFPQAIRIEYNGRSTRPRFDPKDIKKWALSFKERRAA